MHQALYPVIVVITASLENAQEKCIDNISLSQSIRFTSVNAFAAESDFSESPSPESQHGITTTYIKGTFV